MKTKFWQNLINIILKTNKIKPKMIIYNSKSKINFIKNNDI